MRARVSRRQSERRRARRVLHAVEFRAIFHRALDFMLSLFAINTDTCMPI